MNSFIKTELQSLLKRRLAVIADHQLRNENSVAHLAQLASVSEAIDKVFQEHKKDLPPRLCHFLAQASFQKALEFLEAE